MLNASGTSFCLCHGLAGNADVLNLCANGAAPPLFGVSRRTAGEPPGQNVRLRQTHAGPYAGPVGNWTFYLRLFDPSVASVLLPFP